MFCWMRWELGTSLVVCSSFFFVGGKIPLGSDMGLSENRVYSQTNSQYIYIYMCVCARVNCEQECIWYLGTVNILKYLTCVNKYHILNINILNISVYSDSLASRKATLALPGQDPLWCQASDWTPLQGFYRAEGHQAPRRETCGGCGGWCDV